MLNDQGLTWLTASLGVPEGASPFPWQTRLLQMLLRGDMPSALDLPTGLGKTSVMAIWLVARALGATLPRRLIYVVDRRAVVDQATAVAEGLRATIDRVPDLRASLGLTGALPISTLRGQHADNREWLADPTSPAIVLGTADMIGSRLLFSGYGVSNKMRPFHAGLLGADAWLVLDEAHLVPPFERLLDRIASGLDAQGAALGSRPMSDGPPIPRLRVLTLSATGRQRSAAETFTLDADDLGHPVVRQRLQAPKRIRLFDAVEAKALPETLALQAWQLCAEGRRPGRILVFVNSREHAQKTQQALAKLAGKTSPVPSIELFVGGRRVYERQSAAQRLAAMGFLAGTSTEPAAPAFVIATSAGEVGVDLDADHAVCDLVTWERMVQRLGRVNRRGHGDASVMVVPMIAEDEERQAMLTAVRQVLERLPRTADGAFDGSPLALMALKADADAARAVEAASTPAPLHPPLTRALVDAWAMTSLALHTGRPEVHPWLRGWPDKPEDPQVSMVWRRHLPLDDDGHVLAKPHLELFLDAAGPHLTERLEAELPQVLDWLLKRAKALDVPPPAPAVEEMADPPLRRDQHSVLLMRDGDAMARVLSAAEISATSRRDLDLALRGCTVWLDRRWGGLREGLLNDTASEPARDVTEPDEQDTRGPVPFRVRRQEQPEVDPPPAGWRLELSLPVKQGEDGVLAWLSVISLIDQQAESEEGRSSAQRAQHLAEHQDWAEAEARALAQALSLPPEHSEMLAVAAALHDEGKRASRWQQAFHAPDRGRPPYAKTVGRPDVALLGGYRHEFGSLPYAEAHPRLLALSPELRELCLHLIAAHHGMARPLIRTEGAEEPPSRAVARARAVALRFAALSARWGPWGLAWWEALLRAADQRASRRNDEEGRRHG